MCSTKGIFSWNIRCVNINSFDFMLSPGVSNVIMQDTRDVCNPCDLSHGLHLVELSDKVKNCVSQKPATA